jgi:excisionase family DNA binding protein
VDSLLTVDQVAELLAKKKNWIYSDARRLGLPMIKIGRHLRVRRADLDQWLEGLRDGGA